MRSCKDLQIVLLSTDAPSTNPERGLHDLARPPFVLSVMTRRVVAAVACRYTSITLHIPYPLFFQFVRFNPLPRYKRRVPHPHPRLSLLFLSVLARAHLARLNRPPNPLQHLVTPPETKPGIPRSLLFALTIRGNWRVLKDWVVVR